MVVNNSNKNIDGIVPKSSYLRDKESRLKGITPGQNPILQAQKQRASTQEVLRSQARAKSRLENEFKKELQLAEAAYESEFFDDFNSKKQRKLFQQYKQQQKKGSQINKRKLRSAKNLLAQINKQQPKKVMQGGGFIFMVFLAIIVDISDIISGVGTLTTICFTAVMMLYLQSQKIKLTDRKLSRFAIFTLIDMIPVIEYLPMETALLFSLRTLENNAVLKALVQRKFTDAKEVLKSLN